MSDPGSSYSEASFLAETENIALQNCNLFCNLPVVSSPFWFCGSKVIHPQRNTIGSEIWNSVRRGHCRVFRTACAFLLPLEAPLTDCIPLVAINLLNHIQSRVGTDRFVMYNITFAFSAPTSDLHKTRGVRTIQSVAACLKFWLVFPSLNLPWQRVVQESVFQVIHLSFLARWRWHLFGRWFLTTLAQTRADNCLNGGECTFWNATKTMENEFDHIDQFHSSLLLFSQLLTSSFYLLAFTSLFKLAAFNFIPSLN